MMMMIERFFENEKYVKWILYKFMKQLYWEKNEVMNLKLTGDLQNEAQ